MEIRSAVVAFGTDDGKSRLNPAVPIVPDEMEQRGGVWPACRAGVLFLIPLRPSTHRTLTEPVDRGGELR